MKKLFLTLLSVSLMNTPAVLAQTDSPKPSAEAAEVRLDYLITEDFTRFERLIREETLPLDMTSRYRLYLNHQLSDSYAASFLNIIPGGGVGSFTMGDTNGGWILLGGEIASLLVAGIGGVSGDRGLNTVTTAVGAFMFAGFRVYGMYRPMQYSNEYNQRLQRALNLPSDPAASRESLLTAPTLSMSWGF